MTKPTDPVEFDREPSLDALRRLEHVHVAGVCRKNRHGAICDTPTTAPADHTAPVHGIDRRTQEHLCGTPAGLGTDAIQPSLKITCPGCIARLGDYR